MKKLSTTLLAVIITSAIVFKACEEAERLIAVLGIELNQTAVTLPAGTTFTLVPTVSPADASNPAVNWTSTDTTVATVAGGTISAIAPGTSTIMAITVDGGRMASTNVTVTQSVIGVTLDRTTDTLVIGTARTLTATVLPENADNKNVTWGSSNTDIATVTNGIVTAISQGIATITVTTEDGGHTATYILTVIPETVAVTGVTLNQTTATMYIGNTLTLTPTVLPTNATNRNVTWSSSNTTVATVLNGVITAVSAGTATITVTTQDGNFTATCVITVSATTIPATGVTINQPTATMGIGGQLTLVATVQPANATNRNVTWTSNNTSVATVSTNGVVTAISAGTATITATTQDGNFTATSVITVGVPVASVSLNQTTATLNIGNTLTLVPTVLPENALNRNVTWTSSNTTVATVLNGVVTAISTGSATITVTTQDGNRTATCVITVLPPVVSVTGVTMSQASAMLAVGNTVTLTANVQPANATNRAVTWTTSNPAVATVNNGVVTAVGAGSAIITVTTEDGNFTATSTITAFAIPVTGITVNPTATSIQPGNSTRITANVLPANASNRNVTWTSSNPSVAVVDSEGNVMAITWGWTTITATTEEGNFTATSHVVVGTPVTGITVSPTSVTINAGSTTTLTANVLPANATNREVTWSSNNPAVATVNDNGVVTAVSAGTATITATTNEGNRTATATIIVPDFGQAVGFGCNNNLPGWGNSLGTVSFATAETWIVGNQEWSDAVVATTCANRTTFNGGTTGNFNADCRNSAGNDNFSGHYFSWCAVMRFADQLCPPAQGWRVPTLSDFETLHQNLGSPSNPFGTYTGTTWGPNGGIWGGARFTGNNGGDFSTRSTYWSSTEASATNARLLDFNSSNVRSGHSNSKSHGYALRCVRNN